MIATARLLLAAMAANLVGAVSASSVKAGSESDAPPPLIELRPLAMAPSVKIERIDGEHIDLRSLRGKAVLLSFWATWCPPCRREMPMLESLWRFEGAYIEVVAVSVDRQGKSAVAPFLERLGVTHLLSFLDPVGRIAAPPSEARETPFILRGMPISYVIDPRGRVAGYITGEVDWTSQGGLALLRHYFNAR
ncbi:TlpA disulfide reductase family protein [Methylosinus sporium]|uniref:TlpA disulfide reductase family protein n=1 Tax=Methylosinus sporium TaxID=428 RepID=UPI00383B591E